MEISATTLAAHGGALGGASVQGSYAVTGRRSGRNSMEDRPITPLMHLQHASNATVSTSSGQSHISVDPPGHRDAPQTLSRSQKHGGKVSVGEGSTPSTASAEAPGSEGTSGPPKKKKSGLKSLLKTLSKGLSGRAKPGASGLGLSSVSSKSLGHVPSTNGSAEELGGSQLPGQSSRNSSAPQVSLGTYTVHSNGSADSQNK